MGGGGATPSVASIVHRSFAQHRYEKLAEANLLARTVPASSAFWALWRARPGRPQTHAMRPSARHSALRRDAENELYDRGCDLVEAATAIRPRRGQPRRRARSLGPSGCVEAALRELNRACAALEVTTVVPVEARRPVDADPRTWRRIDRAHRGFANLYSALDEAEAASAAVRALAARTLAAATATVVISPPADRPRSWRTVSGRRGHSSPTSSPRRHPRATGRGMTSAGRAA
jgi:hypothetical protein